MSCPTINAHSMCRAAPFVLDVDTGSDGPKWVQVARAGTYLGYSGGSRPFAMDKTTFDQAVANVKSHPSYVAENGVGVAKVVPWDFNHASEYSAVDGSLPFTGSPSQGWTYDMETRLGTDGVYELWALTEFLEPAKSYVKDEKYRWASISLVFDAVDPVSGSNVGAYITSIALTNTPFIEGMEKLVAEKTQDGVNLSYYDAASSASEAIEDMKRVFGLPATAGVVEVMSELQKVLTFVETGSTPLGADVEEMTSSIKKIMNLPALEPASGVIGYAMKIVESLLEEQAINNGNQTPAMVGSNIEQPIEVADQLEVEMPLLEKMSDMLNVRPTESDVAIAVADSAELRKDLVETLSLEKDSSKAILEAVAEIVDVPEKLESLVSALGAGSVEEGVVKIAELAKDSTELEAANTELEELRQYKADAEKEKIAQEVDSVMSSRKLPEEMKDALVLFRTSNPEDFKAKFPVISPDKANLTKDVATQGGAPINVDTGAVITGGDLKIDLSGYAGNNKIQRAMNYLQSNSQKQMTLEDLFKHGVQLSKQPNVIDR